MLVRKSEESGDDATSASNCGRVLITTLDAVTPGNEDPQGEFDDELRKMIARSDPVPESVLSRARQAGRVSTPEGSTLLDLAHDSVLDEPHVRERITASRRRLTFSTDEIRVDLCVELTSRGLKLSGTTTPVAAARVSLRTEHQATPVDVNADGSFVVASIARVPTSILFDITNDETRAFHTSWFLP